MSSNLVYSTDPKKMCPQCGYARTQCSCHAKKTRVSGNGNVRVGRETQGRKGKGVTVISGLPLAEEGLLDLARELKQKCGSGGTVKDAIIEIQGDHREVLVAELIRRGFAAKRSGG